MLVSNTCLHHTFFILPVDMPVTQQDKENKACSFFLFPTLTFLFAFFLVSAYFFLFCISLRIHFFAIRFLVIMTARCFILRCHLFFRVTRSLRFNHLRIEIYVTCRVVCSCIYFPLYSCKFHFENSVKSHYRC